MIVAPSGEIKITGCWARQIRHQGGSTVGVPLPGLGARFVAIPVSQREHRGLRIGGARFTLQTGNREPASARPEHHSGGGALAVDLGLGKT